MTCASSQKLSSAPLTHQPSFITPTLLCPSLHSVPASYNVYLNVCLSICLSTLLPHLPDCEPLRGRSLVWFNTVPRVPPQCRPLGVQKCRGNLWMGGVHVSVPLSFWAGGPRRWSLATSLTAVEEAALLGSKSSLLPPAFIFSHPPVVLLSCIPGLICKSQHCPRHLGAKWSLPSGAH